MSFAEEVRKLLEANGWRQNALPVRLLDEWSGFVRQVDGYSMCIYEYENDMSVRKHIERVMESSELARFPEHAVFLNAVAEIDTEFQAKLSGKFFREDRSSWWERGILLSGVGEYARDIEDLYGISVSEA